MSKFTQIQLVLAILIAISNKANSFTKYGRGCQDIGCLPNQVCVMAQDSCNLGQRDGKECGSYPTCKNTGAAKPPGPSLKPTATDNSFYSPSLNPTSNTNGYNNQQWPNNNPYPPQNTNTIFGSRQNQQPQIDPNIPIFPFNHPTSAPPPQQFPQAHHPDSVPKIPQTYPNPQNPYQPPYVFGNQPSLYNPQATTREPGLLEQFLYNKQDRPRQSNSSGQNISDIEHKPTFNTNANADNNSPYGGSNSGNTQSNGGLYPSLPNQNNMQGGSYYPGVNPGGYVPPGYNPSQGGGQSPYYGNGGYQPQPNNNNGGNRPAYNGGGGYSGGGSGGYSGGAGGGGYSGGGGYNRGGYSDPSGGQKDKGNGFLTGILQNPHVSSAISGIIAGQIQKAITGRNEPNQPNRGGYNDGYGGGAGTGSSGSSGAGNLIGGLISGYLSGGGGSSSQNRGSGGSGGGLGFIGDLIGGGGSSSSNRGGGGAGGAISDFFSSKNRGGLFSENPSSNTNSHQQYSSAKKDYPTQPPYNYNYNG